MKAIHKVKYIYGSPAMCDAHQQLREYNRTIYWKQTTCKKCLLKKKRRGEYETKQ